MCIAILNTKQTTLKKQLLRNCWENNGDGAGILYINNDNKLEFFKEMNNFDTFYDKYIDVRKKYGKRNMVLHFRISTHGKVNTTNCHPFLVNDSLGFVHNGMIYDVPTSTEFSDTYMFNESILKNFTDGFEYNETIMDMIEGFISNGSKLVFLNDNDDWFIVNEKAGHWNLGCWFSNSSYKQVNDWVDFGGIKKKKIQANTKAYDTPLSWSVWDMDGREYTNQVGSRFCECCDTVLRTDEEIDGGICEWCIEDSMYDQECDCCQGSNGKYRYKWEAYVCDDCNKALVD
jgi:hypothetical protein